MASATRSRFTTDLVLAGRTGRQEAALPEHEPSAAAVAARTPQGAAA